MRRPIVFVVLAGVGAVLAAFVVFSALSKREAEVQRAMARSVQIVVAAHDIQLGTKIEKDAVKLAPWARDNAPQGGFTDPQAVVGSFAKSQFVANEPVVASKLFMGEKTSGVMPLLIPPGMRAMSVPVDEVADIAGFVQPHTHVDILAAVSGSGPGDSPFSRIVLQNVEVIAVAQEIERIKDEPIVVKVVTLLVSPQDAEKLSLASREGTLRLAMRNYGDNKIVTTSGIAMDKLMHGGEAAVMPVMHLQPGPGAATARPAHHTAAGPIPYQIEILRDGKSSEAISFVNSTRVRHASDLKRDWSDPIESPPPTASLDPPSRDPASMEPAPSVPRDSADGAPGERSSASITGAAEVPMSAAAASTTAPDSKLDSKLAGAFGTPVKQGEPGYVAAPKTYQVR
jgi:pilus assembly protein CpaB